MAEISRIKDLAKRLNLMNLYKGEYELKQNDMSNLDYLEYILNMELSIRENKQLINRKKQSKIPKLSKSFENTLTVSEWHINHLKKCIWIDEFQNLILVGKSNTGKTILASMLGNNAVENGKKTYYIKTDKFIEILKTKDTILSNKNIFALIKECQLLIIDEFMYLPFTKEEEVLLYKVMSFLNESLSMILITNREISEWINYSEDKHLMQTLTDRIKHGSQILYLDQKKSIIKKHPKNI